MVKHIILWKLKENLTDKDSVKKGIKEGLEGLAGKIPGLQAPGGLQRGCDAGQHLCRSGIPERLPHTSGSCGSGGYLCPPLYGDPVVHQQRSIRRQVFFRRQILESLRMFSR